MPVPSTTLFGTLREDPITSFFALPPSANEGEPPAFATPTHPGGIVAFGADSGVIASEDDLNDQFVLFQFSGEEGAALLEPSSVKPRIKGSEQAPDVLAKLQLAAFHIGENEEIDKNTRATIRLDFGKDDKSNSRLDTLFWSIAAGLNLYNSAKTKKAEPKDLNADLSAAFSRRPIEIPGGLGRFSFEVVKHEEPKWWQRVFSFLQSGTGQLLTSTLGFPAITSQAISFINELVGRLQSDKPSVLFRSRPLVLALSEMARDDFTGGATGVSVGALNPGFCLLARGRDYQGLITHDPVFMASYGVIKPKTVTLPDFLAGRYENPFKDMTYAVLKVGCRETKIDTAMLWG